MKIMMVGDVVGKPGRDTVLFLAARLKKQHRLDFIIVNAENAAGGIGITREIGLSLLHDAPVDVLTLGNHAWAKREVYNFLDAEPRVLRPANYPPGVPGRGFGVYPSAFGELTVLVLQGRTFMDATDDPFRMADSLLEELRSRTPIVIIDFHAEATSEKQAFGWFVDGRASAVIGTHTHVQTADERILPGGTAYLTDVGMTGPINSVIGMKREVVIPRFTTLMPSRFEVAEGPALLSAVLMEIDPATGRALNITRIQETVQEDGWKSRNSAPFTGGDT